MTTIPRTVRVESDSSIGEAPGPNVEPGKEEEFRYLQCWLAASDRLDRLIEGTEPGREGPVAPAPAPVATVAASESRDSGLRADFAARLARLALALHPEAAAGAILQ